MQPFVRAFNQDGHDFIPWAVQELLRQSRSGVTANLRTKIPSQDHLHRGRQRTEVETFHLPPTFAHFVMNLPASAIGFLGAFRGVYRGHERYFEPDTTTKLPMIHVYCFLPKENDHDEAVRRQVCRQISAELQSEITPETAETEISDVRDVSRVKNMYRVSFRLPAPVAFAGPDVTSNEISELSLAIPASHDT